MVHNAEKLELAIQYRKRGFTYDEIAKICDVSKGTVSNWLKNEQFSKQVKEDNIKRAGRENTKRLALMQKARATERSARYTEAVRSAETEFKHYKKDGLFIAGLMAYAASGDMHQTSQIRLSTNRFHVQRTFIAFLKAYLGVVRKDMRLWLLLHEKHNQTKCLKEWSKAVKVSVGFFSKSQFVKSSATPLHFGTLNTIIGSTVLKKKLMRWEELLEKELKKTT